MLVFRGPADPPLSLCLSVCISRSLQVNYCGYQAHATLRTVYIRLGHYDEITLCRICGLLPG